MFGTTAGHHGDPLPPSILTASYSINTDVALLPEDGSVCLEIATRFSSGEQASLKFFMAHRNTKFATLQLAALGGCFFQPRCHVF